MKHFVIFMDLRGTRYLFCASQNHYRNQGIYSLLWLAVFLDEDTEVGWTKRQLFVAFQLGKFENWGSLITGSLWLRGFSHFCFLRFSALTSAFIPSSSFKPQTSRPQAGKKRMRLWATSGTRPRTKNTDTEYCLCREAKSWVTCSRTCGESSAGTSRSWAWGEGKPSNTNLAFI